MARDGHESVTIVGAGIAGMSAALRLLEAGFDVTVIERADMVGGQFGAVRGRDGWHEHAYHVFADWCRNFWDIAAAIGLRRDADFEDRPTFRLLTPRTDGGPPSDGKTLQYVGSPEYFWTNVNSGVADWSHMLIYGYSLLDLLSDQSLEREEFLNRVGVNGYMRSRAYASDVAALLHHELLLKVFAVPSYETSARSYQKYLQLCAAFPYPSATFVVLRGNCVERFWEPFLRKLAALDREGRGRFDLRLQTTVKKILLNASRDRVTEIVVADARDARARLPVEHLIVAIPPRALFTLLNKSRELRERVPELLDVGKLRSIPVAALDLAFTRRLPGIPPEHVTLLDDPESVYRPGGLAERNGLASEYGLSFIDNSQLWPHTAHTCLSVLAGDAGALAGLDDAEAQERMIRVLERYLEFDRAHIDWERSRFQSNTQAPLFTNTVGSWANRPEVRLDGEGRSYRGRPQERIRNLFLAGDYCRSTIDIVCVEGAIVTGLSAARALTDRVAGPRRPERFDPAEVAKGKRLLESWLPLATDRAARLAARHAGRRLGR